MRKSPLLLIAFALLVAGGEAMAGMSYNYAEGDVSFGNLKRAGNSFSGAGTRFEGAVEIEQELYGFLGFGFDKLSDNGVRNRFSTMSLGVGGHLPLQDTLDFVATVAYERVKLRGTGSLSDGSYTGWGVTAGLRGQPYEKQFQWTAGIRYRALEDLNRIYGLVVGGRYYLNPSFALGLDLIAQQYDKDTLDAKQTTALLTLRYDLGTRY